MFLIITVNYTFQAKMTAGSGDFLIAENIYPNKAYNDQDQTLITDTVMTFYVSLFLRTSMTNYYED